MKYTEFVVKMQRKGSDRLLMPSFDTLAEAEQVKGNAERSGRFERVWIEQETNDVPQPSQPSVLFHGKGAQRI